MRQFILCASFSDVAPLLKEENINLSNKTIGFINTASLVEKYTGYVDDAKEAFKKLDAKIIELDVIHTVQEDLHEQIMNVDVIYVSGGNSFFLLDELKKKQADLAIVEAIDSGSLYIGESAGAIITAPNIEYIKLMDNPLEAKGQTDFTGLNLVDYYVLPHYQDEPFVHEAQAILDQYSKTLPLKTVRNSELLIVSNNQTIKKILV